MKRIISALTLLAACAIPAALRGDALIIAGGGFVGLWDTEIDLANTLSEPIDVTLSVRGLPLGAPCPPNCTGKTYSVPGHGTIRVLASDFIGELYAGPQMIRVETGDSVPAPVVHARSVSQATASQFAELPVVRESSLQALDTSVLAFPGASRGLGTHSNLILEDIGSVGFSGAKVLVEVFDSGGQRLGSGEVSVVGESTFQATVVVDIVGALGVSALDAGQIRVTKVSGEGSLWGVLATVVGDGFLKINVGANP